LVSGCPTQSKDEEAPTTKLTPEQKPPVAAVPKPVPPKPRVDAADALRIQAELRLKRLEGFVVKGASDPKNPWALAHGILAFGPQLKTTNGRLAIDVMVEDFAIWKGRGKNRYIDFPGRTKDDFPVEPHNNLITNALVQAGVPQTRSFKLKSGKTVTLAQLVDRVRDEAVTPATPKQWHDFAWTYGALLHAGAQPKKGSLKSLGIDALNYVESQQAFLTELMRKGQPDKVVKKKQLIYAHTCGGTHMIQSALYGVPNIKDPVYQKKAVTQIETLLFRWKAERKIYRDMRRKHPMYSLLLMAQELKFYGHLLETLSMAQKTGIYPQGDTSRAILSPIIRDVITTIDGLAVNYIDLESVRATKKQVYYDLIGDGCHAIRGLRESLMAFFPRQ
jgi:hypothetical protein